MSIETDLSVTPYFDDYREDKDYYKILFQPSVPVQRTRIKPTTDFVATADRNFWRSYSTERNSP